MEEQESPVNTFPAKKHQSLCVRRVCRGENSKIMIYIILLASNNNDWKKREKNSILPKRLCKYGNKYCYTRFFPLWGQKIQILASDPRPSK